MMLGLRSASASLAVGSADGWRDRWTDRRAHWRADVSLDCAVPCWQIENTAAWGASLMDDDEDGAASHEQDAEAGPGTSSLWSQFQVSFYPLFLSLFPSRPSFPLPPCSLALSLWT
jgi:hypothetical protein